MGMVAVRPLAARLLLYAAATSLGACVSARAGPDSAGRTVHLDLHNNQFEAVRVYVARGGSTTRITRVDGLERRRIAIPAALVASGQHVQLVAITRSGRLTIRSVPVMVRWGDTVVWHVEAPPLPSAIRVRAR